MSIPAPPAVDQLARFPVHQIPANGKETLSRIVRRYDEQGKLRSPLFFSGASLGRFDPPPGSQAGYGTCYFGREPITAFVERFGRFRVIPNDVLEAHELVQVVPVHPLHLADACSPQVLGSYGLTREICTVAPDYSLPQQWSLALRAAGFDGIWYGPRHDPRGDLRAVGFFGSPGAHEPEEVGLRIVNHGPIPHDLIRYAAQAFGLYVIAGDQR